MNINDLPDDCLFTIFAYFNDLENLSRFYSVCLRWRRLISKQLAKYKILFGTTIFRVLATNDFPTLHTCSGFILRRFFPLMPNVRIILLAFYFYRRNDKSDWFNEKECYDYMYTILNESNSIKGICDISHGDDELMRIQISPKATGRLEMLSAMGSSQLLQNIESCRMSYRRAYNWKQIRTVVSMLQSENFFRRLPNLQRLSVTRLPVRRSNTPWPDLYNLKILECELRDNDKHLNIDKIGGKSDFQFIDACPFLESLFIFFDKNGDGQPIIDWNIKNVHLRDLVLETDGDYIEKNSIERILMKYPDLKHLAIRGFNNLRNEDVPGLLKLLPKLVLIDLRSTSIDEGAIEYIDKLRKYRPITLIHNGNVKDEKISREWPPLKRSICDLNFFISKGFDFMRNCFFMPYLKLPYLMYSDEEES